MNKEEILNKLTLEEQTKLFVGKNHWEIDEILNKSIFLSDGPHGIRKEINNQTVKAICYPSSVLSACCFDIDLIEELGKELAKECVYHSIDILLGPGVNIKRNPLGGRNFEYFSEDPFLSGKLASAYINGLQSMNVGACLKHFALNSQEYARFVNDSIVDERAMYEIYLKAFQIAIKESKPYAIMASYNKINGVHATENFKLLNQIGRKEFGFDGVYISDWGAVFDPIKSVKNGLNLEMPGNNKTSSNLIYEAIKNNELDIDVIKKSTDMILNLYSKTTLDKINVFDLDEGLKLCKKINDESIVLLKNENILPLNRNQKIALIGEFCKYPRYQGSGSSKINSISIDNLFDQFISENLNFTYARGYDLKSNKIDKKLIKEACEIAKNNDVVVLLIGLPSSYESEGFDRENLRLPKSHSYLLNAILNVNQNVVLVLENGSPVEIENVSMVKGIIESYLGGSKAAESLKDIIIGKVNPSGRLAETFPLSYEDVPSKNYFSKNSHYSLYKESIYVGYRYYDTFNKRVLFPFGYGLSYSKVDYKNLQVKEQSNLLDVQLTISNLSDISTKETIQIYVGMKDSKIFRAKKELKAFKKIYLEPHQTLKVNVEIPIEELRYYSIKEKRFILEKGTYIIYASKNVSDENLFQEIYLSSGEEVNEKYDEIYYLMNREVNDSEFQNLIGKDLDLKYQKRPFTKESTIEELSKSLLGFIILKPAIFFHLLKIKNKEEKNMMKKAIPCQPIRSIEMLGGLDKIQIEGIVDIMNWHLIKGIKKLIKKEKNI